jgi:hypothetical protein
MSEKSFRHLNRRLDDLMQRTDDLENAFLQNTIGVVYTTARLIGLLEEKGVFAQGEVCEAFDQALAAIGPEERDQRMWNHTVMLRDLLREPKQATGKAG